MNLIDSAATTIDKFLEPEPIHLGTANGLYDILRNKKLRYLSMVIYWRQAEDRDLKRLIRSVLQDSLDHIKRIEALIKKYKLYNWPNMDYLEKALHDESPFSISRSLLDDKEISSIMREVHRLSLTIEAEALRNATEPDARKVIYDILNYDNKALNTLIRMKESKGWTDDDLPPYLSPPQ